MMGGDASADQQGLIPRLMKHIASVAGEGKDSWKAKLSLVEVYKERIRCAAQPPPCASAFACSKASLAC